MRLLLDTHAVLWWLANDRRLGRSARALIEDRRKDVLVSVVSLWEITIKVRVGKLQAEVAEIQRVVRRDGMTCLDIGDAHLAALAVLPCFHRDPFDHMLLAQSVAEGATFVSDDQHARHYPVRVWRAGRLWTEAHRLRADKASSSATRLPCRA